MKAVIGNRILVIGCPGAGKSTFARALREKTGLPLYYLDMIFHLSDKTTVTSEEFDEKLHAILKEDKWIIDGNYLRTMPERMQFADTVFFLDYSLDVCLEGVRNRIGTKREDMPWVEEEFDDEFQEWINDFSKDQKPVIEDLLRDFDGELYKFFSRGEAEQFLKEVSGNIKKHRI